MTSVNVKRTSHQFAFVEFKHEESVPYALALFNGISLFDKPVNIKPRDNTEMARKLAEAASIARNMHTQEQLAAIGQLQHMPRWPLVPPGVPPPNPIGFYAQLAVAQSFNPMMARGIPLHSPPLMSYPPPGMPPPWQQHFPMPTNSNRQSSNDDYRSRRNYRDEPRRDDSRGLHRNQSDKIHYDDRNRSRSRSQRNYNQHDYR